MRNLPEWVIAFWASIAVGAVVVPAQRLVDRAPSWPTAWATRAPTVVFVDEERQAPDPPPPRARSPTCGPWSSAARSPTPTAAGGRPPGRPWTGPGRRPVPVIPFADRSPRTSTADATLPDVDHRPRRRRHHLLHLGHHRAAQGSGRHPPQQRLQPDEPLLRRHRRARMRRDGSRAPTSAAGPRTPTCCRCPLFHATGCHAVLVSNTAAGGKLVMMHHFDPERALELIERERITIFGGRAGHGHAGHRLAQLRHTGHLVGASRSPTAGRRARPTWCAGSRSTSRPVPPATATA